MDGKWLKTQFDAHPDKTKRGLAKTLGLEPPAISKILAGTREIKAREYKCMREYFGLPIDGDRATAPPTGYVLKPLNNTLQEPLGQPREQDNWIMPASILAAHTQSPPEQIKIFSISENAMAPDFLRGEQVLVDLSDKKPSPPGAFIISDGLSQIIRQCEIVPHSAPPQIKISARREQYESYTVSLDDPTIIGRVIAKLQWL